MTNGRLDSPATVASSSRKGMLEMPAARRWPRWASLLGAVALVTAACGGGNTSTTGTLRSLEATPANLAMLASASTGPGETATIPNPDADPSESVVDDVAGSPDAGPEDDSTYSALADKPVGPPLPPLSTAEQVLEVVSDMHGPTADAAAQMNRLVDFPEIPTPERSQITEVRADVRETVDGTSFVTTAEVRLSTRGSVDEQVEYYEAAFGDLGWEPITTSGLGPEEARIERRGFDITDSTAKRSTMHLAVQALDEEQTSVGLRFVELSGIDDSSPRSRFEGWAGELPLPAGGVVTGAAIQTSNVGRHSLHYSLALRYGSIEPAAIASELREALPVGDYRARPQPATGDNLDNWVYLEHPLFVDARVSPHPINPAVPEMGTVLNVDARVEFSSDG